MTEPEIPRYKKRATKRPVKVVWTYIGPKDMPYFNTFSRRYRTLKDATQGIESFRQGKGSFGPMFGDPVKDWSIDIAEH